MPFSPRYLSTNPCRQSMRRASLCSLRPRTSMDVPPPTPGAAGHRSQPPPPPMLPRYSTTPRALAVGGHATRRSSLDMRLRRQGYVVTACSDPVVAMAVLRDRRGGFNVVVVDMSPPRSGALELFECAISEMHLPAYAMSQVGNLYGPLAMEDLDTFRQTITSKASNESRSSEATPNSQSNGSVTATASTVTTMSSAGRRATRRRRQLSETESQEVEQDREHGEVQQQPAQRSKKPRLVWTPELHSKFVDAHNKLLPRDAVPKKILKLMNDDTLTRENIASHLQKYRLNMKQPEPLPLHRGNRRTKYHRTAPSQASMLFPNMSQQQDILMAHRTTVAAAVCMNYGFNAQTMIRAPTVSNMQINRPELHIQAFEAANMNKVPTVHARDELTVRDMGPKQMYTGAQVEHELDVEPKLVIAGSHNNSDGSFQEDISKAIQQTLNKDPGPSWDYEFLHNSD